MELKSSRMSEEPDAGGEGEEWSLSLLSAFMAMSTEAASSSCTCWCLEMSSLEVYCHSGVCSQLDRNVNAVLQATWTVLRESRAFVSSRESVWEDGLLRETDRCFVRQLLCLYPLPHFSHFNSLPLVRLPSALREPSLARRIRDLEFPFSCSGMEASGGPSVTASVFAAAL